MMVIGLKHQSFDFLGNTSSAKVSTKWMILIFSFILILIFLLQNKKIAGKAKWMSLMGFVYISLSWGLMMNLYEGHDFIIHESKIVAGPAYIPLVIIASIWINDTMAYIVGSLIGKTPLSEISPKKTWEGTVGGVILSAVLMFFLWNRLVYGISEYPIDKIAGLIALIASITGTIGDLLESKLKRMAGVKDSGHIMPGHGGFLDRFDSMLLATPAVWIFVYLFM
jgi:phosphatidate cytidylyltransferase